MKLSNGILDTSEHQINRRAREKRNLVAQKGKNDSSKRQEEKEMVNIPFLCHLPLLTNPVV